MQKIAASAINKGVCPKLIREKNNRIVRFEPFEYEMFYECFTAAKMECKTNKI